MKYKMLIVLSVAGFMIGCGPHSKDSARATIDSLTHVLKTNQALSETMEEVGVLIDSIDANRNVLRARMVEGTTYDSYVARMRDINQYVKKSKQKIDALEKTARRANSGAYTAAIKRLKADLETRDHEIAALSEQVNQYRLQNEDLVKTVSLREEEIREKMDQIKSNQEESARLHDQISQLMVKSKLDEGESYFARANAVEET
ncbi:MAG TPA: hypothetical protein PLR06_12905, partial [Cyclobacteriaceae bacterium]|nr:hypothetical protein [Cyclobacteriaceae bacterium]